MCISTEEELEERLSRPSLEDIAALKNLAGDLLVLGAAGKMGPSLVRLARRAAELAHTRQRIIAVARFSRRELVAKLNAEGIETIECDLLEPDALRRLPDAANVVFMAARKFGTTGSEYQSWAINTHLPGLIAERYRDARIVCFSSGNVYPLRRLCDGGSLESDPVGPVGEYAQSVLGRERMFEHAASQWGTRSALLRLNYAIDLRYGVLVDIGLAVYQKRPVDLRMPLVNVIWQGDANSICLRCFEYCQSPPFVLNVTGPETLSVRQIAREFAKLFGVAPTFSGDEAPSALLNNAGKSHQQFGYPRVTSGQLIAWTAHWISSGGSLLQKPTGFQVRDGQF